MNIFRITSFLIYTTSIFLFFIGLLSSNINVLLVSLISLSIGNAVFCLKNIKNNILFFCFNTTFFIFLIGRMVVTTFFGYKEDLRGLNGLNFNDPNLVIITIVCFFLSLFFIFLGYKSFSRIEIKLFNSNKLFQDKMGHLQLSSLILFYASIIFRLYIVFEMRKVSVSEGYYETFNTFQSNLPSVLQTFGDMYDMFFYAFLATFPSKKKVLLPASLYILEGVIAASSGRRSVLMLNVLLLLIYLVIRNNKEKKEVWFGKKEVIGSVILFPFLMTLMTFIGNMRSSFSGSIKEKTPFFQGIMEFFYSQGVSANLIGYTEIHKDSLPNKFYSIGPLLEFIDNNIIRPIQGKPILTGQTAEKAMEGFLYSLTLPYFIEPKSYLMGYGWGSSLVAENYFDLGYIGVIIGGFLYGLIIVLLSKAIQGKNFLVITFSLSMSRILLFSPRGAYLSFLVSAFAIRKIIAVVLVIVGAFLLRKLKAEIK